MWFWSFPDLELVDDDVDRGWVGGYDGVLSDLKWTLPEKADSPHLRDCTATDPQCGESTMDLTSFGLALI